MSTYRITDTPTIKRLATAGSETGYNRQLNPDWIEANLDPEGNHLCVFAMVHEHIGGREVEPHMRGQFLMKVNGTTEPVSLIFDLSMEDYDAMTEWQAPDATDAEHEAMENVQTPDENEVAEISVADMQAHKESEAAQ